MNFKQIKIKMLAENFIEYCKKNNITRKNLSDLELLFYDRTYLNEAGIGDWLMDKASQVMKTGAGKFYQIKLNQILKKVNPLLTQLNKSQADIENLIQSYSLNDDKIATDVLQSLKDLKEPFQNFVNKAQNLSTTAATGMRSDKLESPEEGANPELTKQFVDRAIQAYTTHMPSTPTDTSNKNKELFAKAVKAYYTKLDPDDLQKAEDFINSELKNASGDDVKLFQLTTKINRQIGQRVSGEEEEGVKNVEIIKRYVNDLISTYTSSMSSPATPESTRNKDLFSKVINAYFTKLDPNDFDQAVTIIKKDLNDARGNETKLFQVINKISKQTGKPIEAQSIVTVKQADNWVTVIKDKYFKGSGTPSPLHGLDDDIVQNFLKGYKNLMLKVDPVAIAKIQTAVNKRLTQVMRSTNKNTKEANLISLTQLFEKNPKALTVTS